MIEIDALTKRYGDTLAVDDLTFRVPAGQVTGFLGPNGAGKSTTMRMILGIDHPTAGHVSIGGRRYDELTDPLTHVGALLEAKAVAGAGWSVVTSTQRPTALSSAVNPLRCRGMSRA